MRGMLFLVVGLCVLLAFLAQLTNQYVNLMNTSPFLMLLYNFGAPLLPAYIAKEKGHNPYKWYAIAFFFTVLTLIYTIVFMKKNYEGVVMVQNENSQNNSNPPENIDIRNLPKF